QQLHTFPTRRSSDLILNETNSVYRNHIVPNKGIAKILSDKTPHPDLGNGIPRCELYLYVENIELEFENAIKIGAQLISPIEERNWVIKSVILQILTDILLRLQKN